MIMEDTASSVTSTLLRDSDVDPHSAIINSRILLTSPINAEVIEELEDASHPLPRPISIEDESAPGGETQIILERGESTAIITPPNILITRRSRPHSDTATEYTSETTTTGSSIITFVKLPPLYASLRLAPIALFYGLATGILGPVLTELVKFMVCQVKLGYPNNTCANLVDGHHTSENNHVLAVTSHYTFFLRLAENLPCVFIAIFTGSWSDHFGRKMPMLIPFCAMFISSAVLITFAYVPVHPAFLLIAPLIPALFGGFPIALAAMFSFMGDYSSPEMLAIDLAIFDGVWTLSTNLGSLTGGILYGLYGFPYPFMLYTGLLLLTIIYITLGIRDRRVLEREFHRSHWKALFTTRSIIENKNMLAKERLGNTRSHILTLLICVTLGALCSTGAASITQLFYESAPLNWTVKHYTTFSSMTGVITGLVLMAFVPMLKKILLVGDTAMSIIGVVSAIFSFIILSGTFVTWLAVCSVSIGALSGLQFIAVRSLLSNLVDQDERGKMMFVIASLQALVPVLGSLLFTSIFAATVSWWAGFSFMVAAGILLFAMTGFCYVDIERRKDEYNTAKGTYTKL